jgi:hypothetical protein
MSEVPLKGLQLCRAERAGCHTLHTVLAPVLTSPHSDVYLRVVHLGQSTCHAISGRGE